MAIPGIAKRLTAGTVPQGRRVPLGQCDATASGSEDAQVQLTRGLLALSFCAHHAEAYGLALIAAGWHITHDNRDR